MHISRRNFITSLALGSAAALLGISDRAFATGRGVVVVGGGSGGATAARYLRLFDPTLRVTLIEPQRQHQSCLMSNEVLAGMRKASSLQFDYVKLSQLGINVVHDKVVTIDAEKRRIKTQSGDTFPYERCIISPGIDFRWADIEGYDAQVAETFPHAWNAGKQLITLQQQLQSMQDGGTVLITTPKPPYRCPTAPYERASLIAHYLQQQKPKSKVIILDANPTFIDQRGFKQAWRRAYHFATEKSLIERQSGAEATVTEFDAANKTVITQTGQRIKADVINIIPPQQAGNIAATSGLVDESGWCPVNLLTFESHQKSNIHVIGDAAIVGGMSKLASSANAQGKACAAAVVALLNGRAPTAAPLIETRYSIIGHELALSSNAIFKPTAEGHQLTQIPEESTRKKVKPRPLREFYNAHSWYNNITQDIFG
ncbi:MAG: NAD(P)/FAD-dependent oxidoreductase [Candidatus Polarisedimenticolaceae bacterium]|nr:NAD(P)/FAD-dependent oxidoreductase [Candidatus Polarisedimenticolaceae bacterium]